MAEVIPSVRGPGYAGKAAEQLAAFDANAAERLKAALEARSTNLGHILGNSTRVADIAGSGALDKLMTGYADAQQPVFGGEYASAMDRLRMAQAQADVAATNRRGTSGGSAPKPFSVGPDEMLIHDNASGNVTKITTREWDTGKYAKMLQDGSIKVLEHGAPVPQEYLQERGIQPEQTPQAQPSNKPEGTIIPYNGGHMITRNGVWVPYDGE